MRWFREFEPNLTEIRISLAAGKDGFRVLVSRATANAARLPRRMVFAVIEESIMFSLCSFLNSKAALGLACAAALAADALASTHSRRSLPEMLETSKLVFDGTVIGVEHRNSDVVAPGDRALPHTFVTFRIESLVKGSSADGNTITLRFLGGPDGTGRVMTVAGLPQFRVGDRDVLFVKQEGDKLCPIVDWEHGRMRIVRGDAYTALGGELWITPEGGVVHGERKIDLASPQYPTIGTEKSAKHGDHCDFEPPSGAMRVDAQGLTALLRHQWNVLRGVKALAEPSPESSARVADPLPMPFRAVRPKVAQKPASPKVDRERDANKESAH